MNYFWFVFAAACEITGCYAFWLWLRLGRNVLWVIPGTTSLLLFAFALTRIESSFAGRVYAAYGGVYIISSLVWLSWVEKERIIFSDYVGILFCLTGSMIILLGPRMN